MFLDFSRQPQCTFSIDSSLLFVNDTHDENLEQHVRHPLREENHDPFLPNKTKYLREPKVNKFNTLLLLVYSLTMMKKLLNPALNGATSSACTNRHY